MQLLGDFENGTKELIFSRSLADAPEGGEEIKKGYAFNKIYHRISQITDKGQSAKLLQEVKDLSHQYGLATPYSDELSAID